MAAAAPPGPPPMLNGRPDLRLPTNSNRFKAQEQSRSTNPLPPPPPSQQVAHGGGGQGADTPHPKARGQPRSPPQPQGLSTDKMATCLPSGPPQQSKAADSSLPVARISSPLPPSTSRRPPPPSVPPTPLSAPPFWAYLLVCGTHTPGRPRRPWGGRGRGLEGPIHSGGREGIGTRRLRDRWPGGPKGATASCGSSKACQERVPRGWEEVGERKGPSSAPPLPAPPVWKLPGDGRFRETPCSPTPWPHPSPSPRETAQPLGGKPRVFQPRGHYPPHPTP
ncbi:basic proline-rich protein-like, partial [Vombatus ursinus]|uniref:basic proline-rich protein-like n=1 Tax=Vombatus ursinus TaxID=29139 RepID=UPI000FFDA2B7